MNHNSSYLDIYDSFNIGELSALAPLPGRWLFAERPLYTEAGVRPVQDPFIANYVTNACPAGETFRIDRMEMRSYSDVRTWEGKDILHRIAVTLFVGGMPVSSTLPLSRLHPQTSGGLRVRAIVPERQTFGVRLHVTKGALDEVRYDEDFPSRRRRFSGQKIWVHLVGRVLYPRLDRPE